MEGKASGCHSLRDRQNDRLVLELVALLAMANAGYVQSAAAGAGITFNVTLNARSKSVDLFLVAWSAEHHLFLLFTAGIAAAT